MREALIFPFLQLSAANFWHGVNEQGWSKNFVEENFGGGPEAEPPENFLF